VRIVNCIQGSAEWLQARQGKPTASKFSALVTPTGASVKGKTRQTYMLELLAERLTGKTQETRVTDAMVRGSMLEPRARAWYELETGAEVTQVGFVLADGERWGASPDGLVQKGGIEIKCLNRAAHLRVVLFGEIPEEYVAQVQGNMWVTGRYQWDYVAYTDEDGIPSGIVPVKADEKYWQALDAALPKFCDELDELEERARKLGGGLRTFAPTMDNSAGILND